MHVVRVVKFASPASLSGVSRRREQWLDFEARAWSGRWGTSSAESSHVPVGVQVLGVHVPDTDAQASALVADESEQVPHSTSVIWPLAQLPNASQSSLNATASFGAAQNPDMPGPYKIQSAWLGLVCTA